MLCEFLFFMIYQIKLQRYSKGKHRGTSSLLFLYNFNTENLLTPPMSPVGGGFIPSKIIQQKEIWNPLHHHKI